MADLTALSDLKSAFGEFEPMSDLINTMQNYLDEITSYNKEAAGNDGIGQTYHQSVDTPTKNLTDLMKQVHDAVFAVGVNGQDTADAYNQADDEGTQLVGS
jgi:hypothetical protein